MYTVGRLQKAGCKASEFLRRAGSGRGPLGWNLVACQGLENLKYDVKGTPPKQVRKEGREKERGPIEIGAPKVSITHIIRETL